MSSLPVLVRNGNHDINVAQNHCNQHPPLAFSEIGPIPPPRMFSDSIPVSVCSNNNSGHDVIDDTDQMSDDDEESNTSLSHLTQPVCIIRDQLYEESQAMIEEIPAKEPQLSAVPKKSALKKPRFNSAMSCPPRTTANPQTSSVSSSTVSVTSSFAPLRPQPLPRFSYTPMFNGPVQLFPTGASSVPLSLQNRSSQNAIER